MEKENYTKSRMISDYDLYLACEGTHRSIQDVLGCREVCNSTGNVDGYYFSVWAPNAKCVSVVGDFNNWSAGAHPMQRIPDTGYWELYIEGITQGHLYKYCLLTQDNQVLFRADPCARFAELRPGTASVTYSDNYRWHDLSWRVKHSQCAPKNEPISIYEMHLGSWMRGRSNELLSYREVADALVKFLTENRYTHVEIMPIAEHPYDGSWGYQITGYFAPTSRYGTPEDFKYFVDTLHNHQIGVIMDWVPVHFPKDEHGLRRFDGTPLYEGSNPMMSQQQQWGTLKFDMENPQVRQFLISNALYWLRDFHVDGLRVDAVSCMIYLDYGREDGHWQPNIYGGKENLAALDFLKTLNNIVHEECPGALMIAEESSDFAGITKPVDQGGLGFDFKWNMGWMNDTLEYMGADPLFRSGLHNKMTFSMMYAYNERYILPLSHDECVHGKKSILDKMAGDYYQKFSSDRAYLGYMLAHPGKKLIFMGTEIGQFMEWRYYEQIEWKLLQYDSHRSLYMYVKELLSLYRDHPAFWAKDDSWDGFRWLNADDAQHSVYSMARFGGDETIVIVLNMTPVARFDYWVNAPEAGTWELLLNSDEHRWGGENNHIPRQLETDSEAEAFPNRLRVTLPPLSVLMYQLKK